MTRTRRTGAIVAGLALAATGIGVAVAADSQDWYTGDVTTVADPHRTTHALTLHDASGAAITSGSTTSAIAAFAAADAGLADGDTHAQLFAHLPRSGSAAGAWPGVQASGTDRFTGSGAVAAPSGVTGKAYVRLAGGYSVGALVAALPNSETSQSWAGVYELRLRTSSASGVADDYAATWIKVDGSTWSITSAPVVGETSTTTPKPAVASSVSATWPSFAYGKRATVAVKVTATGTRPTGDVTLLQGSTRLGAARLASDGTARITVAAAALQPGKRDLTLAYAGVPETVQASTTRRTVTVGKGKPGAPKLKVTTKPTSKKKGKASVSVNTASGLKKASGKVTLTLTKGKAKTKVTAKLSGGKKSIRLPKLVPGTWKASLKYSGDARFSATSGTTKFKVTR